MEDGDYIVYKRQKIKRQKGVKPISIKITPAIRQLIGSLQAASPTVDDFLLPIVTRSGYTGERLYMHIRARYSKYQKYLRLRNRLTGRLRALRDRLRQSRTHRFFKCPECGVTVRVPKGKGKIKITCPKCRATFVKNT